MQYELLGRTGLKVSQLCFGTMSFGGDANEEQSGEMFDACRDAGINFFDCANVYSNGLAETILGKLIKGIRDDLIVTSKCFGRMGEDQNSRGANRRNIIRSVEDSLQRLGTDRLDVLFMHQWDGSVPLEETLRALESLVSDGKVVHLGASNYSAWQIAKGLGISTRNAWSRFDVIQPMYSLVKRQVEVEILPLAREEGLGVISYSPVGGGLLSGKYGISKRDDGGRLVTNQMYANRYAGNEVLQIAGDFTELAQEQHIHPVSLAVAWAGYNPDITCPIIGARSVGQLQPSLDAINVPMNDELYERISDLSPRPAPATDRSEDQV